MRFNSGSETECWLRAAVGAQLWWGFQCSPVGAPDAPLYWAAYRWHLGYMWTCRLPSASMACCLVSRNPLQLWSWILGFLSLIYSLDGMILSEEFFWVWFPATFVSFFQLLQHIQMSSLHKFKLLMSRQRDFLPPVVLLRGADVGKFQKYNSRMGFFIPFHVSVLWEMKSMRCLVTQVLMQEKNAIKQPGAPRPRPLNCKRQLISLMAAEEPCSNCSGPRGNITAKCKAVKLSQALFFHTTESLILHSGTEKPSTPR